MCPPRPAGHESERAQTRFAMWAASARPRGAALRCAATGRPSLLRHCTALPAGTTLRVQAKGAGNGVGRLQGFDESAENLGLPRRSTLEYLVSPRVKDGCHAVLYHQPSDTWRFHSTREPPPRRAAERMCSRNEAAARGAAKSRPGSTWWSYIFARMRWAAPGHEALKPPPPQGGPFVHGHGANGCS